MQAEIGAGDALWRLLCELQRRRDADRGESPPPPRDARHGAREGAVSGHEPTWRGAPPPEEMNAREVLFAVKHYGAEISVAEDGRLRFTGAAYVPGALVLRAAELADEIRAELGPPGSCSTCDGTVFYLHRGRWRCVGCRGLPEGEAVPETWARAAP